MNKEEREEIRAIFEAYLAYEINTKGRMDTAIRTSYSFAEGHRDFLIWLADGGLPILLDEYDKLETELNQWKARAEALEGAMQILADELGFCEIYCATCAHSCEVCDPSENWKLTTKRSGLYEHLEA